MKWTLLYYIRLHLLGRLLSGKGLYMYMSFPGSTDVRQHGALGDGASDDSVAIQRVLDSSRDVYAPPGVYKIGRTLRVKSGTRLRAHQWARFVWADGAGTDQTDFLLTNENSWHPESDSKELDRDIEISGGIWDGNAKAQKRSGDYEYGYSGVMIHFAHVRGLRLHDMTVRNSNSYYVRMGWVRDFVVERIAIQATALSPNQDGIHLGGCCEDGRIEEISAHGLSTPNDDMVAMNADDAIFRPECNGVPRGPIRRVKVRHLRADDCHSFVRMASVTSPIEDIEVDDVAGGCQICAVNVDALRYCRTPLFKDTDAGMENGVGSLRGIRLSRFNVHKSAVNDAALLRLESRMHGVVVEDFRRDVDRDVALEVATLMVRHVPGMMTLDRGDGELLQRSISAGEEFGSHAAWVRRFTAAGSL